jgi:uncharacterized protein YndB with AHSA1/START domain
MDVWSLRGANGRQNERQHADAEDASRQCAHVTRIPCNVGMTQKSPAQRIRYPERYEPGRARVYVSNELIMTASCERVWSWLVRADLWPSWYPNSSGVRFETPTASPELELGTSFRWKTFGITLDSVVEEFVPRERIAWTARAVGVDAYHAWLLEPTSGGCRVLTEETQHGWLASLSDLAMPKRMHTGHQLWLERLQAKSASGSPPPHA